MSGLVAQICKKLSAISQDIPTDTDTEQIIQKIVTDNLRVAKSSLDLYKNFIFLTNERKVLEEMPLDREGIQSRI